jgi:hypothetical protein
MSTMNTLIADLEAIPLADMTKRDQLTFAAAIGHLRRLSDRVHTLEISQHRTAAKIAELERENARLRAALERIRKELEMHINWKPTRVAVEVAIAFEIAREALAGSGEK